MGGKGKLRYYSIVNISRIEVDFTDIFLGHFNKTPKWWKRIVGTTTEGEIFHAWWGHWDGPGSWIWIRSWEGVGGSRFSSLWGWTLLYLQNGQGIQRWRNWHSYHNNKVSISSCSMEVWKINLFFMLSVCHPPMPVSIKLTPPLNVVTVFQFMCMTEMLSFTTQEMISWAPTFCY